ncbi:MAG: isoleucine--tRNA ligase [Candidatus Omnitrophica bacterium]|nr:isoleucine--tRNA ligase [Candidatus Omnitrophota bacterium]
MSNRDYSTSVLLPKTGFPMKADLTHREPERLSFWEEKKIYQKLQEKNAPRPKFILHDGPPYANGHIHLGTALNKILKDIVVKQKSMVGFFAPYVPGWDCHGMPIEHQALKEMKASKNKVNPLEFRKKAASFARKFVAIQREEFKRLGVLGDWENPYLTLSPEYEAAIISAFGRLALAGYVYQDYKPIHWCFTCETALAEAEIEYEEDQTPSIYVAFPLVEPIEGKKIFLLIWTTTPWTLPANQAIAVYPEERYVIVETAIGYFLLAESLSEQVLRKKGISGQIIRFFSGRELENWVYTNPLTGKVCPVVLADYVSTTEGTGCVHTAPGHGLEDYYTGQRYHLPIFSPVDHQGRYTSEILAWQGIHVFQANELITKELDRLGLLYHQEETKHSYPHCWRCKQPVIFRSTKQWFLKVDHQGLRQKLQAEIVRCHWVPAEGANRILSMVQTRPDWCLSRQRLWGVPLPIFYCQNCSREIITQETLSHVEQLVRQAGSDIWLEKEARELLPPNFSCPYCGHNAFEKEKDILDVWFDSGVSHLAVLTTRTNLSWPADVYLEGSDQHRGWFQTSLITSCGLTGQAPFRTVVTHGFVVDAEGRKMSKSLGNVITPEQVIKTHGAEVLRLWVASENYQQDIRISDSILRNLVTVYRTIRNTIRFLLGNLYDFTAKEAVNQSEMEEVDRWALAKLHQTTAAVTTAYEEFLFYRVYELLYEFCNLWLSSFYLDYLKDRLYTHGKSSRERRAAQTVLQAILLTLLKLLAPILSFTAEEAYQYLPDRKKESIFLEEWPEKTPVDTELLKRWERFFLFRKLVLKKIEEKREEKLIGTSLAALVQVKANQEWFEFLSSFPGLPSLLLVSEVKLSSGDSELEITIEKTPHHKCQRCWIYHPSVGSIDHHPELCLKCATIVSENCQPAK